MSRPLPENHDPAAMQALVDALLVASRSGDSAAVDRIRAHPRFENIDDAASAAATLDAEDAQAVVAGEYGFASWRRLMVYITHPAELEDFLQLSCLNYFTSDRPANYQRARALLTADPSLGERDIWHAACVGDVQAVRRFLDADAELADRLGGYFDWPPLLYACYSRLDLPGRSTLAVAELLLERGADPNAHYMWGGQYRFTALTGVFGEGEMGPVNQPPHEERDALARLLLQAGANPNDGQALYNTMFTPDSGCLRLLLEYGLDERHRNNWLIVENDEYADNPSQTLGYQLEWAARNHHVERAKLLIDNGAEVRREVQGRSLYEWAWLTGHPDLARYLLDHGAEAVELDASERFAGVCMSGDVAAARAMLATTADLVSRTQEKMPDLLVDAAGSNRLDAVGALLDVGFDVNRPNVTALHQAAFHGHLAMAQRLVANGADIGAREDRFAATPLQWALTGGEADVADYLASLEIGIFDAVLTENTTRIEALLDAEPGLLETTVGVERAKRSSAPHNEDWPTPLAFAVARNNAVAVRLLLERGAKVDVRDPDGRGLVEIARQAADEEIVAMLAGRR